ncbi:hypothetical protein BC936DRAFT_137535 [Jimgerdemannia flammicorona]|uniref:Uncharacterized protein n=1 Tax=Jimgerdemannia flammicorona TaxID=994334 RepID=A0A433CX50_9FUNG|nr:hypothetical protein BC936DRAFT_137535 [Jimgerdemannia flammicorona]
MRKSLVIKPRVSTLNPPFQQRNTPNHPRQPTHIFGPHLRSDPRRDLFHNLLALALDGAEHRQVTVVRELVGGARVVPHGLRIGFTRQTLAVHLRLHVLDVGFHLVTEGTTGSGRLSRADQRLHIAVELADLYQNDTVVQRVNIT